MQAPQGDARGEPELRELDLPARQAQHRAFLVDERLEVPLEPDGGGVAKRCDKLGVVCLVARTGMHHMNVFNAKF